MISNASSSGWLESKVDEINAARVADKTDGEIRALAVMLEAASKTFFSGTLEQD